jgi:hypothetical protein
MKVRNANGKPFHSRLQLEAVKPVEHDSGYKSVVVATSAPVYSYTLPHVVTEWFVAVSIDRRAFAAGVRNKLGAFVKDWEAPGMEEYDAL